MIEIVVKRMIGTYLDVHLLTSVMHMPTLPEALHGTGEAMLPAGSAGVIERQMLPTGSPAAHQKYSYGVVCVFLACFVLVLITHACGHLYSLHRKGGGGKHTQCTIIQY